MTDGIMMTDGDTIEAVDFGMLKVLILESEGERFEITLTPDMFDLLKYKLDNAKVAEINL